MAADVKVTGSLSDEQVKKPSTQSAIDLYGTKRPTKKQLAQADDYFKLKQYYYERYMSQLRDKVAEIDHRNQAEFSRPSNHQGNKSLYRRSSLKADIRPRTKPKTLPAIVTHKSKRYTLIEAEEKLTRAGLLDEKNVEDFRVCAAQADNLDSFIVSYMQEQKTTSAKRSARARPLSQIAESRTRENSAGSRPVTRQRQNKKVSKPKGSSGSDLNPFAGNKKLTPSEIAKAAALALEERCPRMPIPNLYCLRPEEEIEEDEEELRIEENRAKKKAEYSSHIAYLRQMYQRAQANTAQAKRILDKKTDSVDSLDQERVFKISDLEGIYRHSDSPDDSEHGPEYSYQHHLEQAGLVSERLTPPLLESPDVQESGDRPIQIVTHSQVEDRINMWREESNGVRPSHQSAFTPIAEEAEDRKSTRTHTLAITESPVANQLVPYAEPQSMQRENTLSLQALENEVKVIESKALSTYWPNYLGVGESQFARKET